MNAPVLVQYAAVVIVSFAIVAALGRPVIAALRNLSFRQNAYEDAPKSHAVKTGTPTMGGVLFAFVLLPFALLLAFGERSATGTDPGTCDVLAIVGLGLACGAIGFADDLMSVRLGRNRGLNARTKFALTAVAAVAFLVVVTAGSQASATLGHPVWLWVALALFAILGTTHAVNLTDGLDGLAAGTIVPPLLVFAWIANGQQRADIAAIDLATVGAVLGFLVYNRHPARVFMGDTGSLLLGGILAGSAIALHRVLLLPLVGAVFAAEALSVILQVAYFKRTHKRIFKMSPLHHHFELSGWPETKVTMWFWAASALCSVAGVATTFARQAGVP
jgi:phospho-N-acetylmuramoyl-pentapeptide-transferase